MRSKAATGAARAARASRGRSTVTRTRVAPRDALVRQPEAQVGRPAAQWPQAGPRPAWPQGMQGLGTMFLFGAAFSAAAGIVAAMEPHGEVLTVSEDEAVREADELYEDPATTPVQLLRYLRSRTEGAAHVPAALRWRLARALSDTAEALDKSDPRKKELLREALEQSKAAVAQDDGSFAAHKWCGIALSRWGEYEGTKVKIENAYAIREHFERACELNPGDATSRHLLGRWCMDVAQIGWFGRKLASTLFATPPQSTMEEALRHFLEAERLQPGFWKRNRSMIAWCYRQLNDKELCAKWLKLALELPARTEEDREVDEKARHLLEVLGYA